MSATRSESRYMMWLFLIVTLNGWSFGTTVVIMRRPDSLIVGSDSLTRDEFGKPTLGCKIRHNGTIFFAAAGVMSYATTGFDVFRLASDVTTKHRSIQEAATAFRASSFIPFQKTLQGLRDGMPEFYNKMVKRGPEPLQVVFFGIEHSIPKFVLVYFRIKDDSGVSVKISMRYKSCPGSACAKPDAVELLGENAAAHRVAKAISPNDDDAESVRRMVDAEKAASPAIVNGPTEVIVVDSKGFHWAHNDQDCE